MAIPPPARTASTQARGTAFKTAVLDACLTQLADVGFERLAIPKVAELAGVNKTSIYRRWPSKADLVRDALALAMRHAGDAPNTGHLHGDLCALARTVAAFTQSREGTAVVRIMFTEAGNPEVRALATTSYADAGKQGPWIVIERAIKRGEIGGTVDPSLMLFTVAGAIMHRVFVERRDVPDEFLHQLVDLVLYGAAVRR
jgi:AcrR family transcriptional regulator